MFERVEGKAQEIAGSVQEAVGQVTDDASLRVEGQVRQVAGKAQDVYGAALNQMREYAVTKPIGTMAAVGAMGFLLGLVCARR
ncbi:MAG: CsbD family protein [Xanthomonadaceae bacterium]|nr:CsbD family protein [Xanthomonadaceae bacterium]